MFEKEKRQILNEDGDEPLIFKKNIIFYIFEDELQAELFNARCNDACEPISQDKARTFKEEFNSINSKKNPLTLNLHSMRFGVGSCTALS